jgi:hypothetical protein
MRATILSNVALSISIRCLEETQTHHILQHVAAPDQLLVIADALQKRNAALERVALVGECIEKELAAKCVPGNVLERQLRHRCQWRRG